MNEAKSFTGPGSVSRTSVRYAEDPGSSPGPVKLFALFIVHKNSKIIIYIYIYK